MNTTKLSSKGQIIIPKLVREKYKWQTGLEFIVVETEEGILLTPKRPFLTTTLADVAGCLPYAGEPKSIAEMETAVQAGLEEAWHDRR